MILARAWVVQGYAEAGGFLFGRRTYENLAGYWPNASEEEQVIAEPLNSKPKFVASRTLTEPSDGRTRPCSRGTSPRPCSLKQEEGPDLHVIGSADFAQTLIEHDLVDEYRVMIDPLVMGGGKRLFREGARRPMRLVESQVTTTGAILATYAAAGE